MIIALKKIKKCEIVDRKSPSDNIADELRPGRLE